MKKTLSLLCLLGLLFFGSSVSGQQLKVTNFQKQALNSLSANSNLQYNTSRQRAIALAISKGWVVTRKTKNGGMVSLQGINSLGFPIYLVTHNNVISAATTSTNTVQPGGVLGLNLSGSSTFLNNKLAIWDGGLVYQGHQEFAGKSIIWKDTASILDHATHVSGTMLAKGVYAPAKGMAFNSNSLLSYDFNNDVAEMSAAASGLLLSNHSYGDEAGWNIDENGNWDWYGLPGDTVDYSFGFYGSRTQSWDNIAYSAPYYLIVESAGNSHSSIGPAVGQDYYGYESITNQTFVDKGPRPPSISSNSGYNVISGTGNAKNISLSAL